jgi:catechol-2,3-dioxygenase
MERHVGRLIDHVHLRARNFGTTARFYKAILNALGVPYQEGDVHLSCDELWIDALGSDQAASHVHLAFQAADRDAVVRFHKAGLEAGGRDNGAPLERSYHPGYYAAFLLDPDGNNIEAVHHGPSERSAKSVLITAK